jgi:NAD(P)-dependent dehydrogenase (short-subunit alcohol dehydrogenase family)
MTFLETLFSLKNKVVVITGAGGSIAGALAKAIAQAGANVVIIDIVEQAASAVASEINHSGGTALPLYGDVLDKNSLENCLSTAISLFGRIDCLINGAGGNRKEATTSDIQSFFEIPVNANKSVFDLNFIGTLLASQVFGKEIMKQQKGSILNIASIAGFRPLTQAAAYAAAKAAVINFTKWLAVHICQNYSTEIRVNAIAPGFCSTHQNKYLLYDAQGRLTERGEKILRAVPAGRFAAPEEFVGAAIWLLGDSASYVTGTAITIDGGFDAFSGV